MPDLFLPDDPDGRESQWSNLDISVQQQMISAFEAARPPAAQGEYASRKDTTYNSDVEYLMTINSIKEFINQNPALKRLVESTVLSGQEHHSKTLLETFGITDEFPRSGMQSHVRVCFAGFVCWCCLRRLSRADSSRDFG